MSEQDKNNNGPTVYNFSNCVINNSAIGDNSSVVNNGSAYEGSKQKQPQKAKPAKIPRKAFDSDIIRTILKYVFMGFVAACIIAIFVICCLGDARWGNWRSIALVVLACLVVVLLVVFYLAKEEDVEFSFLAGLGGAGGAVLLAVGLVISDGTSISALWKTVSALWDQVAWHIFSKWALSKAILCTVFVLVGCLGIVYCLACSIFIAKSEDEPAWYSVFFSQLTTVGIVLVFWVSQGFWVIALAGVVGSCICYIKDYNDSIDDIFSSTAFNVGLLIIGYAIGLIIESMFPDYMLNSFLAFWG